MTEKWAWTMLEIREGKLLCRFADGWKAVKYDETPWHKHRLKSRFRAIDILATDGAHHWWIEIKDCMGHEQENLPRLSASDSDEVKDTRAWIKKQGWHQQVVAHRKKSWIVDEVVSKLHHTLAAMALAEREREQTLRDFCVIGNHLPLSVVLLLTWDSRDFKRLALRLQDKLRKATDGYNCESYVCNVALPPSLGLNMNVERIQP